jgi:hypothetical protein
MASAREARSAGTMPNNNAETLVSAAVKPSTRQSRVASRLDRIGVRRQLSFTNRPLPQYAKTTPTRAPVDRQKRALDNGFAARGATSMPRFAIAQTELMTPCRRSGQ